MYIYSQNIYQLDPTVPTIKPDPPRGHSLPGRLRLSRRCQPLADRAWSPANLGEPVTYRNLSLMMEIHGNSGRYGVPYVHDIAIIIIYQNYQDVSEIDRQTNKQADR